jgi:hypothetical protein
MMDEISQGWLNLRSSCCAPVGHPLDGASAGWRLPKYLVCIISDTVTLGLNPDLRTKFIRTQNLTPVKIMLSATLAVIKQAPGGGELILDRVHFCISCNHLLVSLMLRTSIEFLVCTPIKTWTRKRLLEGLPLNSVLVWIIGRAFTSTTIFTTLLYLVYLMIWMTIPSYFTLCFHPTESMFQCVLEILFVSIL